VVFHGSRTMGALRLDLPGPDAHQDLAGHAIGTVCRLDGADGVVPVVYADEPFAEALDRARTLLDDLLTAGRRAGLTVKDVLCVAADGYGSLLDPELPTAGRPLSD